MAIRKYTAKDGEALVYYLKELGWWDAKLIGSLAKGKESTHDIDILLPFRKLTKKTRKQLKAWLEPKKTTDTDWGGIYLHDTLFGDVDVFFSDKDFDY